jgi:hypothetical protein
MPRPVSTTLCVLALLGIAACSPKFDWREIRSTADAYAVSLPGRPQIITRDVDVPLAGGMQKVSMTMTSAGVGGTMFAVGAARLPPEVARNDAALQSAMAFFRDGLLRNIGVTGPVDEAPPAALRARSVTQRASTSFEARGQLGRQGEKPAAARLAARIYVVDDRLYQIVAMGSAQDLPDSEIETFFTSFHLTAP